MQVLLTTLNAKYIHANLAVRLLYQLNKDYKKLSWKEFSIKESFDEIADFCKDFEVVAFSCYIWNITQTLEVARKIKALNPQTKILLGGPEVSYDFGDVIDRDEVDYIIVGEGEIPFESFLENYPDVANVPALIYKENNQVIQNLSPPLFDLNRFENLMPYAADNPEELRNKVAYVETSRGCPYKCEFCLASLDNKVRYLPMEHTKQTLLYLMQHGKVIKFLDRTFNVKKVFTLEIFQFILDNYKPDNVFQFEITADILHKDIVDFIHAYVPEGLFRFEIGIQTVNQKANLEVNRRQNFDKTKAVIESLKDKVEMHLDLIVGLPLDYFDDIRFSFEEVFKLFPPELQLGFLKFLKGTPVREKYEQYGFVFDPNPPYQIIESNFLSKEQLYQISLLENALEIYWNKKRAVNTLKYVTAHYSIFDFLTELGTVFESKFKGEHYGVKNIYETLFVFVSEKYAADNVLKELVSLDYFLSHKVKPKAIFIEEIDKKEQNKIAETLKLNAHQFRYAMLPISFDFEIFRSENRIENAQQIVIIGFSGTEYPIIEKAISYTATSAEILG
jgi:anaerobic magnesium-protoporphyrin IX monomethyl ester cyclase